MSKLNERLTLVANLSVVAGIIFLAVEMQQNTDMMRAQTRDSITEKQMMYSEWVGTNPETADVFMRGSQGGAAALADLKEVGMFSLLVQGILREWENSHYQYEHGLFTAEEFVARAAMWDLIMPQLGFRQIWAERRQTYAPSFRAEIDRIVAEVEQAQ